jgi:hypothetical protein
MAAEQSYLVAARIGVLVLGGWFQWERSNFKLLTHRFKVDIVKKQIIYLRIYQKNFKKINLLIIT